ncbi:pyridoxal-phosphate dependent enzyme family protein [Xylaria nigripes]|nr:pyridoxal-phosphate dependent enzyme family protein [Xylaria nigripes]
MPPSIHTNPEARDWKYEGRTRNWSTVLGFHETLPDYNRTPLRSLPAVARELGLGHVLVKVESDHFGLPAFKILGASWAVYRAVGWHLGIPVADGQLPFAELGAKARKAGVEIVTATEGDCGAAIARMAQYMGIPTRVWVPGFMPEQTRELIRGEGAEVIAVDGCYNDLVKIVAEEAEEEHTILVLDVSFDGYCDIPKYFVQGYGTMLAEVDQQVLEVTGKAGTHAIVPCGAGSVAESVTSHYKSAGRQSRAAVLAVEPTNAACLHESMKTDQLVTFQTGETIMHGLNCGTLSTTAWPVLRAGIDVSIVISDAESHAAVQELTAAGIPAGPCGAAAALAALRRVCAETEVKKSQGLDENAVVILFCT